MKSIVEKALANPIQFAIGAGIVIGVIYYVGRKAVGDVAGVAGAAASQAYGAVSGKNVITKGTPYEGAGVVGTPAAILNDASGGLLEWAGSALGGWIYDVTHDEYDPNKGLQSDGDVLREGAKNTDTLWGRIGGVILRTN